MEEEGWSDLEEEEGTQYMVREESKEVQEPCGYEYMYSINDIAHVDTRFTELVTDIQDILNLSTDDAITLLKYFHWNPEQLKEKWFEGEDICRLKAGCNLDPEYLAKIGYSSPLQHANYTCGVCYDDIPHLECKIIACSHTFCADCWTGYLDNQVETSKACILAKCMHPKCTVMVPHSFFLNFLSKSGENKYKKYLYKAFTDDNKNIKWCPSPVGCEYFVENSSLLPIPIICKCGFSFCFGCNAESHEPVSCKVLDKWEKKNTSESENVTWIMANTKACPSCKKPIEKNQGCNYILCSQCKYEFCWICLIHMPGHLAHQCKTIDEAIKSKTENAKHALEKYMLYFDRYNSHRKSEEYAKKIKPKIHDIIILLHEVKQYPIGELEFLNNAVDSIIEARRVLMNSYILGYYMNNKKEKNLFEYMQRNLEENSDFLQGLLEKPFDQFVDPELIDRKPFYSYRSQLINYFQMTKKFYNNFIEGTKAGLTSQN